MHDLSRVIRSNLCATASVCVFPRSCTATTAHSLFAVLPMELRETQPCQCRGIRCSRCACVQQHVSQSTALKCPAGGEEEHTVCAVEVFRGMLRVWGTDQCQCFQVRLSLHVARDKLPVRSTRDSLSYRDYVVRVVCVHVDVPYLCSVLVPWPSREPDAVRYLDFCATTVSCCNHVVA